MPPTQTQVGAAPSAAGAWQLLQLHRPELALRMAEQLLARDPADVRALSLRAEALRQLGRLVEALATAKETISQAPQSAVLFYRLAVILGQSGELREAELAVREAIRIDPTAAAYYGFLAELTYLLARPDEAITIASTGLTCNAHHVDCLLWRAVAYERCNQRVAADADFNLALRLAPTSALLHQHWGKMLLQRSDAAGAARHLAEALRLNPNAYATLLPPLRQALRWQYWPNWMVRRHQQLRYEWQQQHVLTNRGGNTVLLLPYFLLISWWKTRRDIAFQQRLPSESWRSKSRYVLAASAVMSGVLLLLGLTIPLIQYITAPLDNVPVGEGVVMGMIAALAPLLWAARQQRANHLYKND